MRAKSITKLVTIVILITAMIYIAVAGVTIGTWKVLPADKGIKKGLDIAGGSVITYEADTTNNITKAEGDTIIEIIRTRLTSQGYTEATVVRQGLKRFIVEIPDVTNPEQVVKLIGQVAKLTFIDKDKNEVLTGNDIKTATRQFKQLENNKAAENYVELELTPEGQKKFSVATEKIAAYPEGENYIAIMLDEKAVSSPRVQQKIDTSTCVISGSFTVQTASELASLIRAGQLPYALKEVSLYTVGASLGESALKSSLNAALISLLAVMLYMILFYRLPGLVSAFALAFYTVLTVLVLGWFGVNLTLPGIAGIILSMGMAVDANVVIFERIIDEMKNGKTLRASVDAGFHRALTAVVDSNVTTLIASIVLLLLGTGTVKGFATTLTIGVLISMFTAIVVTKFIMVQLIQINVKNRRLYGIGLR